MGKLFFIIINIRNSFKKSLHTGPSRDARTSSIASGFDDLLWLDVAAEGLVGKPHCFTESAGL